MLQIQLDAIADSMAVHGGKNTSPGSPRPAVRRSHPMFEVLSEGSFMRTIADDNGRGEVIVLPLGKRTTIEHLGREEDLAAASPTGRTVVHGWLSVEDRRAESLDA